MPKLNEFFPLPVLKVNQYVWWAMNQIDETLEDQYNGIIPFFPLADSRGGDSAWGEKPYVVYDHLYKVNGRSFPYVHRAQFLYFIRGQATDTLTWGTAIQHIVDRGDDAAKDCNEYIGKQEGPSSVFFHTLRGFVVDEASDKRMDLQVRQYYTTSLIVEADYRYDGLANMAVESDQFRSAPPSSC